MNFGEENDDFNEEQENGLEGFAAAYESPDAGDLESATLFVGDLSITCNEYHLIELFSFPQKLM